MVVERKPAGRWNEIKRGYKIKRQCRTRAESNNLDDCSRGDIYIPGQIVIDRSEALDRCRLPSLSSFLPFPPPFRTVSLVVDTVPLFSDFLRRVSLSFLFFSTILFEESNNENSQLILPIFPLQINTENTFFKVKIQNIDSKHCFFNTVITIYHRGLSTILNFLPSRHFLAWLKNNIQDRLNI